MGAVSSCFLPPLVILGTMAPLAPHLLLHTMMSAAITRPKPTRPTATHTHWVALD